jgi:hypothetical protein
MNPTTPSLSPVCTVELSRGSLGPPIVERPITPSVGVCPYPVICRRLALNWGVVPEAEVQEGVTRLPLLATRAGGSVRVARSSLSFRGFFRSIPVNLVLFLDRINKILRIDRIDRIFIDPKFSTHLYSVAKLISSPVNGETSCKSCPSF